MRILVSFSLLASLSACGAPSSPVNTAHRFAALLESESYDAAWALLSEKSRAELDRRELGKRMSAHPEERKAIADRLSSDVVEQRAEAVFHLPDGRVVRLVLEDGEWKLDGSILNVYSQETPRLALRSFTRALENRRYDVILRFIPEADRVDGLDDTMLRRAFEEEMPDETAKMLSSLKEAENVPIEESGDHARLSLGAGHTVLLVREGGLWKLADFY